MHKTLNAGNNAPPLKVGIHIPIRKVVRPTGVNFRGRFPSRKCGRPVSFESLIERDAIILFEFSRGVSGFREQPYSVHYTLNGRTRKYTPDFELILASGAVLLVEVKPEERANEPTEFQRLARIASHFAERGIPFRILTDKQIRQRDLLFNLNGLIPYRDASLPDFQRRLLQSRLPDAPVAWAHVRSVVGSNAQVWRLLAHDLVSCDLRQRLNDHTILSIQHSEADDAELYF
jgi:TnsA endonuclease N terminal